MGYTEGGADGDAVGGLLAVVDAWLKECEDSQEYVSKEELTCERARLCRVEEALARLATLLAQARSVLAACPPPRPDLQALVATTMASLAQDLDLKQKLLAALPDCEPHESECYALVWQTHPPLCLHGTQQLRHHAQGEAGAG